MGFCREDVMVPGPELPPNQQLAAPHRWPVVGERSPRDDDAPWTLTIAGLVTRPQVYRLDELREARWETQTMDVHCVTRWSKLGVTCEGIPLRRLLEAAEVLPQGAFAIFRSRSARGHATSLPLAYLRGCEAMVALRVDGAPLSVEHGGPIRMMVPGKYFYKSVKWLEAIEVRDRDELGYWEAEAGYHNGADPWKEERYLAPTLDKQQAARLLQARDFSGKDLRGLRAEHRDLRGLVARDALLRDAHFESSDLTGADFRGANLSNAHFSRAILRGADFRGADIEGADFSAADLRHADLRVASMFGASFAPADARGSTREPARIDHTTLFDPQALTALTPSQQKIFPLPGDATSPDSTRQE